MPNHTDEAVNITDLRNRIEALEADVERIFRPIADMLPPERIQSIEQTGYETTVQLAELIARVASAEARIASLEKGAEARITTLEKQVAGLEEFASALQSTAVWRTLAGASKLITRLSGRATPTNSQ